MPVVRKHASPAARQAAYRARCKTRGDSAPNGYASGSVYRRWKSNRQQALGLLEQVNSEMENYHNQRSDAWQDSDRGEAFVEMMESVADIVEALRQLSTNPSEA